MMNSSSFEKIPEEFNDTMVDNYYKNNNDKNMEMKKVSASDVTLMSLSFLAFGEVFNFLRVHDFPVAGGMFVLGVVLVYLYHKSGN